jgi:hypothetical protein
MVMIQQDLFMAPKAPKTAPTPRQIETVAMIGRERGLELPEGWERDRAYCAALLDCLAIDGRLKEVTRFVNNLVAEVEQGAVPDELRDRYRVPAKLALTLHRYALKQLGWRGAEDWFSDRDLLNRRLEEEDVAV